jgi:hypothetical protein
MSLLRRPKGSKNGPRSGAALSCRSSCASTRSSTVRGGTQPSADAFAQERELLVEAARIRGQARQDLLRVALRRGRTRAQELGQRALEAAQRAEREAAKADEAFHPQPLLALVDEDVERDLVGRCQSIAGDRLRRGELARARARSRRPRPRAWRRRACRHNRLSPM